jgi:hypothetical protein
VVSLTLGHAGPQPRVITWQDDLHEVLVIQGSVKGAVKVLDDIVDFKLPDLATALVQEAADGLRSHHSIVPSINPCEAAVWCKLCDLGQLLSLIFNFGLLLGNEQQDFPHFAFEEAGEPIKPIVDGRFNRDLPRPVDWVLLPLVDGLPTRVLHRRLCRVVILDIGD